MGLMSWIKDKAGAAEKWMSRNEEHHDDGGHGHKEKGVLESIWDGGAKFVEGVAAPAASLIAHHNPLVMSYDMCKTAYHMGSAAYDAVSGDRHGAIDHLGEGALGLGGFTGMAPILHGAELLGNVVQGTRALAGNLPESDNSTVGEAVGKAANYGIDQVFGKSEHHEKSAGESDGEILGTAAAPILSALTYGRLGPLAAPLLAVAGSKWIGGKIGKALDGGEVSGSAEVAPVDLNLGGLAAATQAPAAAPAAAPANDEAEDELFDL